MSGAARVLVAEDNEASLELAMYLLRVSGYDTAGAHDGREAVDAARAQRPDLILMDIGMPVMDGYAAANALRSDPSLRDVPLIAVTAFAMMGDRERILGAGFDGYITKPISPHTFVREAEAFLPADLRSGPSPSAENGEGRPVDFVETGGSRARWDGTTALVVDDVEANRTFFKALLEPSGVRVLTAASASEALAVLERQTPDIVISDVGMKGGSGFDLLLAVKADPLLFRVPVILTSASSSRGDRPERAIALGAAGFIGRPVEPEAALRAIEDILTRASGD